MLLLWAADYPIDVLMEKTCILEGRPHVFNGTPK